MKGKVNSQDNFNLGAAVISPQQPVVAGSYATITFTYTAGHPVDDTGYLKIVFRYAGDFGTPQFTDSGAPNYCTVSTTGDCRIESRWDAKGHTRPWGRALLLKVMGGFLDTDEQITVVFGDTSGGSPGWQMQTFCEDTFEFKTLVDPIATYQFKELPESPTLRMVPGDPARAVCIAPSQVGTAESFTYHLKLEDRWGNPCGAPEKMTHPGFPDAGVETLRPRDEQSGLTAVSNPVEVVEAPPFSRFWADFHGQSEETIGTNTIHQYFRFAHDFGLVDIAGHQGNDFQITDAFWETINETTAAFYAPGAFVTFPGYEWSGNTPLGGDRNVFFFTEGGTITRSCGDLIPDTKYPHAPTTSRLFTNLKRQDGPRMFVVPHVGGRYSDLSMHDPELEWVVEVHSAWGTFEWLVEDALRMGYRIGVVANSDGHKGRPGASYPGASKFGSYGGLTCVLAESLDRESVIEALHARHCYGTTGHRPLVDVRLITPNGSAMMGDIIEAGEGAHRLEINVYGTAAIESIEVRNGLETVAVRRPYDESDPGRRVKVVWSGAEVRGRARMVTWDGGLRVQDNGIEQAASINFWNANQPLRQDGADRLSWMSATTGGVSGVLMTLKHADQGELHIETAQKHASYRIDEIGIEPSIRACGGLKKQIAVYRLPDEPPSHTFACTVSLDDLRSGDNPIYIRVTQEDGHMAWTSPVYVVKG